MSERELLQGVRFDRMPSHHDIGLSIRAEMAWQRIASELSVPVPDELRAAWIRAYRRKSQELEREVYDLGARPNVVDLAELGAAVNVTRTRNAELEATNANQRAELHALNVAIRERDRLTDARIAELEATVARVRKLPAQWRPTSSRYRLDDGPMARDDCADELEAALAAPAAPAAPDGKVT